MDASESGDGESESKDDGQTGIEPYSGWRGVAQTV